MVTRIIDPLVSFHVNYLPFEFDEKHFFEFKENIFTIMDSSFIAGFLYQSMMFVFS